jgi:hypothetical protein
MLEMGMSGLMSGEEKRGGVIAPATALVLDSTTCSVSGHDFSRAEKGTKKTGVFNP